MPEKKIGIDKMVGDQAVLGTFGKIWLNTEIFANVVKASVKATYTFEDIPIAGKMTPGKKLVEVTYEGEVSFTRVNYALAKKIHEAYTAGKPLDVKLDFEIDDPASSDGATKVVCREVYFSENTIIDFENKKVGEESYTFTCGSAKYE